MRLSKLPAARVRADGCASAASGRNADVNGRLPRFRVRFLRLAPRALEGRSPRPPDRGAGMR
ncbi:hypothetical protein AKJ09_04087 [Labilithrix luteola]|uniref:Uncharacterized protein n=1 Tax=Labilithrix luteola TaxID=1391654 RepID=A0A0K1PV58_9BACT|nr:hypothetical protein AKJ09_04087 [Labilithrix luteola]